MVSLKAGDLLDEAAGTAGPVSISSGHGPASGHVSVRTGTSSAGDVGSILLETGDGKWCISRTYYSHVAAMNNGGKHGRWYFHSQ